MAITAPAVPLRLVRSPLLPHATSARRASVVMCGRMVLSRLCGTVVKPPTAAKILRAVIRSVIVNLTAGASPQEMNRVSHLRLAALSQTLLQRRRQPILVSPLLLWAANGQENRSRLGTTGSLGGIAQSAGSQTTKRTSGIIPVPPPTPPGLATGRSSCPTTNLRP